MARILVRFFTKSPKTAKYRSNIATFCRHLPTTNADVKTKRIDRRERPYRFPSQRRLWHHRFHWHHRFRRVRLYRLHRLLHQRMNLLRRQLMNHLRRQRMNLLLHQRMNHLLRQLMNHLLHQRMNQLPRQHLHQFPRKLLVNRPDPDQNQKRRLEDAVALVVSDLEDEAETDGFVAALQWTKTNKQKNKPPTTTTRSKQKRATPKLTLKNTRKLDGSLSTCTYEELSATPAIPIPKNEMNRCDDSSHSSHLHAGGCLDEYGCGKVTCSHLMTTTTTPTKSDCMTKAPFAQDSTVTVSLASK
mmetsp:Transcript_36416/g.56544  ORF Transcript_36416/g.56544 Transcript_36416/m.56544 type:complete len:301 (-) Transcript_36416:30-932(-)